ncbi:MAG TPA: cyclic nucleotide-binding domain-containing protein [Marinagarivorans sp.]|nr:cyclic nucleotide-binding domain-containing protein [Marinagarivorans sp.]
MITDDVLARFEHFDKLTPHLLLDALDALEFLRIDEGGFLFKRGKSLPEAYYLLDGSLDLIDSNFNTSSISAGSPEALCALNSDPVTAVTARATSRVLAFAINREHLSRLVTYSQSSPQLSSERAPGADAIELMEDDDWFERLLDSHLFSRIPMAHVQQLFPRLRSIPVKAGEKIMREGERGDYFYVLASGNAVITNALGTIRVDLTPGMSFGEEAILGKTPRNATVTMLTDGVIKRLTEEDFNELIRRPVMQYIEASAVEALSESFTVLDVKMPIEFRCGHYPGAINMPLARLRDQLKDLATSKLYLVPDDAEGRAEIAAHILCQAGFNVRIIKGAAEVIYGERAG